MSEETLFADLHIHSCFSIATSPAMLPENIFEGCRKKGIRVVGSGDAFCTRWREMWESQEGREILVVPTSEVEDRDRGIPVSPRAPAVIVEEIPLERPGTRGGEPVVADRPRWVRGNDVLPGHHGMEDGIA
ncbi:MAG: hypothetical protein HGA55_08165, partial [Methanoregulaceae archaeon]|nr:hypothetical protein [Methanoregulaceae archaeon]